MDPIATTILVTIISIVLNSVAFAGSECETENRGVSQGMKAYQVDVLDRIFPDTASNPTGYIQPIHVPRGAKIALQFAVIGNQSGRCKISIGSLEREDNIDVMSKFKTRFYHVLSVPVEANSQGCSSTYPYPARPPADWMPFLVREAPFEVCEVLVETASFDLVAGRFQSVLAEIDVCRETPPGVYDGRIIFQTPNATTDVAFSFVVHPTVFTGYALDCTHWLWPKPENLTSEAPPTWWSEEHWRLLEESGRTLREFGDNHIITPMMGGEEDFLGDQAPLIQTYISANNEFQFEFELFDKWCDLFLGLGFEKIEGGHLGRGHDIIPLHVYAIDSNTNQKVKLFDNNSDAQQWLDFLSVFYQAIYAHLREKEWTNVYVQHLMDEPHDVSEYERLTKGFREYMPGIKNIDAIQNIDFSDFVDVQVFNLPTISSNQPAVLERKAHGKSVWHYQCCSPYPPYPNRWLDRPLSNSRLYPWLGYLLNSEGYLFWAANGYRGADPYRSSIGPLPKFAAGPAGPQNPGHCVGDNWLYYPGPNGLRPSMRMIAFRDGLLDHRLLTMLAKKDKTRADEIMSQIARSVTDFEQSPASYHTARETLLRELDKRSR